MANSTADGSVVIDVDMNVSQAEKRLAKLRGNIKKTEQDIAKMTQARDEAQAKKDSFAVRLEQERAKLKALTDQMTELKTALKDISLSKGVKQELRMEQPALQQQISEQLSAVNALQSEWNSANRSVESYSSKIDASNQKLASMQTEAGILTQKIDESNIAQDAFNKTAEKASDAMSRLGKRIKSMVAQVFVFSLIAKALRAVLNIIKKYIMTNDEARQAIAQLKGAFLTMIQPIVDVVIPAFTMLVQTLTKVITAIAQLVSTLFGKTLKQSKAGAKAMYEEAEAISGVGGAADEASKSLAGFDEINQLSDSSSGGGGGGAGTEISPDFDFDTTKYTEKIDELMVYLSGALLALGIILLFTGANIPLGLGLIVAGAALLASEIEENWDDADGKVKKAVNKLLLYLGTALLAIGAILAFSGANLLLGIGLMVVGAAMLATAVALNWNEIVEALRGPIGEIVAIVSGALLVLGIILCISGAALPLGIALIAVGAAGLATVTALNWDKIVTKLQGPMGKIVAIVSGALLVLGIILCCTGVMLPLGIALIAAGAAGLVTVTALNWDAILDKIKGLWDSIKTWWNEKAKKYFTLEYWKNKGKEVIDGLLDGLKKAWEGLSEWFTGVWDKLFKNKKATVDIDATSPEGNYNSGGRMAAPVIPEIHTSSIPALARGAVIPPNREFLAVLGDQKNGTNIETPLSTMVQAFRQALSDMGYNGSSEAVLMLDRDVLGKVVYRLNKAEGNRIGVNLAGV